MSRILALLLNILELKNSDTIVKIKREMIRRVGMCLKIRAGTSLIHDLRYNIRKLLKPQDIVILRSAQKM